MNMFKKQLIVVVLISAFDCAYAEMAVEETEVPVQAEQKKSVEPEVVKDQSVSDASAAVVDDGQENQELEKYLQELSEEFESDKKTE